MENNPFEIHHVARIVESKETESLMECLATLELKAVSIGEGQNAEVFAAEGTPFEKVCLKKAKKNPRILCNSIDEEHKFQALARKAGVRTPLSLISLETNQGKYFIMERVNGVTVDELSKKPALLPKNFNYETFCRSLEENVEKMHAAGIYHRDLHKQNIMVDENGLAVILDYGTATLGTGSDFTYEESVLEYDPIAGRYGQSFSYFKDDIGMMKKSMALLRCYKEKPTTIDS